MRHFVSRTSALAGAAAITLTAGIAAAGPAAATAAATTTTAQLAQGTFTYSGINYGQNHTISNPPSGQCITVNPSGGPGPIMNQTNMNATIYFTLDCSGKRIFGYTIPEFTNIDLSSQLPSFSTIEFTPTTSLTPPPSTCTCAPAQPAAAPLHPRHSDEFALQSHRRRNHPRVAHHAHELLG